MNGSFYIKKLIISKMAFIGALVLLPFWASAQFNCSSAAYLFQGSPTTVFEVDLASGNYVSVANFTIKINAVGYNPIDDHIYGWDITNSKIVKIDENFTVVESIDPPSQIANLAFAVGDVTTEGDYVIYHPNTNKKYVINLNPRPLVIDQEYSVDIKSTWDLAASPVDGNLYGISTDGNLYRVNATSGVATNLGRPSPIVSGQAFGACYFDVDGNFYASGNNTGMIYRILGVDALSAGANPPSSEFAQGPASGTNDGVKCPLSVVSSEGCTNEVDDDNDDLIDCLDDDCDTNIACTTTGGLIGGLETVGDLSDKIAYRDFIHSKYNIDVDDRSLLPRVVGKMVPDFSTGIHFRNDFNITDFMPIDVIDGSQSYESSPNDLVDLANASQVEAVDIFIENRRVGAVLGIKSTNGIYQHSKYVCDRVKGAEILRTYSVPLVGQDSFPVTYFKNINGGREYSTVFAVYQNEEDEFVVESHWNTDTYPADRDYYNFQVWANALPRLGELTEQIIDNLESKLPVNAINWTPLPRLIVRQHWYENEVWNLILENKYGVKKASFKGIRALTETAPRVDETFEFDLKGNPLDTVQVPIQFYTLGGSISTGEAYSKDQVFVGNGAWGLSYDEEDNNIDDFNVTQGSQANRGEAYSLVERNVTVKGKLKSELTVFRTIQNAALPKDFSAFNTLTFELRGNESVEIVLNKASIAQWSEQPRLTLQTEGQCQQVYVSKNDFYQAAGQTEWNDIKSIAFVFRGDNENEADFELEVRNVAFANLNELPECNSFNSQDVMAFPNPMKDELNLVLSAGGIQTYTLSLHNQLGQLIATQEGETGPEGRLQFTKSDLEEGMYYYTVQVVSGTYTGKVIVGSTSD